MREDREDTEDAETQGSGSGQADRGGTKTAGMADGGGQPGRRSGGQSGQGGGGAAGRKSGAEEVIQGAKVREFLTRV